MAILTTREGIYIVTKDGKRIVIGEAIAALGSIDLTIESLTVRRAIENH
jgi:hypothetical protein